MNPTFKEIDLSQTTKHGSDELKVGPVYLVLYDGRFHIGTFSKQHYGLDFNGIDGSAQYDPPGLNYSSWQRIWLFPNAQKIVDEAEPDYMRLRRNYAIGRLVDNGQKIDETTPLEAYRYFYRRNRPDAMPRKNDGDNEEEYF